MSNRNYNIRQCVEYSEPPMSVRSEVIDMCTRLIEPRWKRILRKILSPVLIAKYRLKGAGTGCQFGKKSCVKGAWLGDYAYFGPHCEFNGPVVVGALTMISSEVQVIGQDHDCNNPEIPMRIAFQQKPRPLTVIEADCWIGSRVTIMEGVRIGRGSVVGAASIVTKSIPPYSIAVGSPAKIIRKRFNENECITHDKLLYGCRLGLDK